MTECEIVRKLDSIMRKPLRDLSSNINKLPREEVYLRYCQVAGLRAGIISSLEGLGMDNIISRWSDTETSKLFNWIEVWVMDKDDNESYDLLNLITNYTVPEMV